MPRLGACKACAHPHRRALDHALLDKQQTVSAVAAQYGMSRNTIRRHREQCLHQVPLRAPHGETSPHSIRGGVPKPVIDTQWLTDDALRMHQRLWQRLEELEQRYVAGETPAPSAFTAFAAELRQLRDQLSRVSGVVAPAGQVNVQVSLHQTHNDIRAAIMDMADAPPAVREWAAGRLIQQEGGDAPAAD